MAEDVINRECDLDFLTDKICQEKIQYPPEGNVFAPFVELQLNDLIFKTGNESYDIDPHKIAIKSMHYGMAQGQGGITVEIELVAEGGTGYREIIDKLNKAISTAPEEIRESTLEFGWLYKTCGVATPVKDSSGIIYILPVKLVTNIDSGVAKLKLECKDLLYRSFSRRIQENVGNDENPENLKDAIQLLCKTNDPTIDVIFLDYMGEDNLQFKNSADKEKKGPEGVWQGNQQPLLATIRNWLNGAQTENERGVYFRYDPRQSALIIQEDMSCLPNEENCDKCRQVLESFIVNGGNCSKVLSFQPSIEWTLDPGGGGGGSGAANSGQMQSAEPIDTLEPIEHSGSGNQTSINNDIRSIPPQQAAQNAKESAAVNQAATKPFELRQTIEAELTIIGDPSYSSLIDNVAQYVSIAVISPFHIDSESSTNDQKACVWIAEPAFNEVLTNKFWFVKGVDHQIEAGKYVTKLKVQLPAGNDGLPVGSPFGGDESGYNPENQGPGEFLGQT